MISIRFLGARWGAPAPSVDASVRGGASIVVEPVVTPTPPTPPAAGTLPDRLEPDQLAVRDLAHASLVGQQVEVPEHLGQGEEGLGHGDVSPQLLGQLVRAPGTLGDQPEDLLGPAPVERQPLV